MLPLDFLRREAIRQQPQRRLVAGVREEMLHDLIGWRGFLEPPSPRSDVIQDTYSDDAH
jgi:hypothetical protein